MQVAMLADHLGTGPQPQVESVAENNLCTNIPDVPRQHTLDRSIRAYWHEYRRFYCSTRKRQAPATRTPISGHQVKLQKTHPASRGPSACGSRAINLASPS